MYSILPATVSLLFLFYGIYVLHDQRITRISVSLTVLCVTSFFWQFTWAFLFQVTDPVIALILIKFGYLMILFLPTGIYHFLTEICEKTKERRYVYLSYGFSTLLAVFLLGSNLFIAGSYHYYFGYYPKAGPLHFLHLLQTSIVMVRGLYFTYRTQKESAPEIRMRYKLCLLSLLIYFFAAIDYLCNYGIEFYPPGMAFILISLGIIIFGVIKYDILNPNTVAAVIAHEIRTPLLTIRLQVNGITKFLPTLLEGYQLAVKHGLYEKPLNPSIVRTLENITGNITREVDRTNNVIDMMLMSASMESPKNLSFEKHSIRDCIEKAVAHYPFDSGMGEKISVAIIEDFEFHGSDTLMILVLSNLLKNALYSLQCSNKGVIRIRAGKSENCNSLTITDTGSGINADKLARIFDTFYTSKHMNDGSGLGLTFCKKVMSAFGGQIKCASDESEYTTFTLEFPATP